MTNIAWCLDRSMRRTGSNPLADFPRDRTGQFLSKNLRISRVCMEIIRPIQGHTGREFRILRVYLRKAAPRLSPVQKL